MESWTDATETRAARALWALACLTRPAGALGLLAVEVDSHPGRPRLWTDGRRLRVSRVALGDWLARSDPTQGADALALAGLALLEAWLREPAGWPRPGAWDTAPVVALPEDDGDQRGMARAMRFRLRLGQADDPAGVPSDLTRPLARWLDPAQGWGALDGSVADLDGERWSAAAAMQVWREAQVARRAQEGPMAYPEETALTQALLEHYPGLVDAWLAQSPVPRALPGALFACRQPRWLGPLRAGGARLDAEQHGDGLAVWAAMHAPAMLEPLTAAGVSPLPPPAALLPCLALAARPDHDQTARAAAARRLLGPSDWPADLMAAILQKSFDPSSGALDLLAVVPPRARLEAAVPTLQVSLPEGLSGEFPLAQALAAMLAAALDAPSDGEEPPAHLPSRLAALQALGVDFSARFAGGATVFHLPLSLARGVRTPHHLYFLLTPLGGDWTAVDHRKKGPLALTFLPLGNAAKRRRRDRFDLQAVDADLRRQEMERTFDAPVAASGKRRL